MVLLYVWRAVGRSDCQQARASGDLLTLADANLGHLARVRRLDDVLHLHRLEHDQWLVLPDLLTDLDGDLDHAARHWCRQPSGRTAQATIGGGFLHRRRAPAFEAIAAAPPRHDTPIACAVFVDDGHHFAVHAEPPVRWRLSAGRAHVEVFAIGVNVDHVRVRVAGHADTVKRSRPPPRSRLIEAAQTPRDARPPGIGIHFWPQEEVHCARRGQYGPRHIGQALDDALLIEKASVELTRQEWPRFDRRQQQVHIVFDP